MIPAAFAYHRPKSIAEAVALLSDLGEDARPLSGGHSLIPMMKLRLAKPSDLVDLGAIAELKGVREDGPDIVIGATTTQHDLLGSALVAAKAPILQEAASVIADPQVRYLGTIGGNVANGDPGNDMPAVMMCLGATYQLSGKGGERPRRGARLLSGRLFHRARARRDPLRHPHPHPAGRARLRLREAEAQDRRLRDRRRRGAF